VPALQTTEEAMTLLENVVSEMQLATPTVDHEAMGLLADFALTEGEDGAVRKKLIELAANHESVFVRDHIRLLLAAGREETNLIPNSSFEIVNDNNGQMPKDWVFWAEPVSYAISASRTNTTARTGDFSFMTSGLNPGGPISYAEGEAILPSSKYDALIHYYVPEASETVGEIQIAINAYGNNVLQQQMESVRQPVAGQKGKWASFWYVFKTESWVDNPVKLQMILTHWNFKEGEQIYIDDVSLYKLN
jgi:hypothetical protein